MRSRSKQGWELIVRYLVTSVLDHFCLFWRTEMRGTAKVTTADATDVDRIAIR